MLGDYGFTYSVSGKVAPTGPLKLDEGHWAAAALGHAWVFNQQVRVVDLVTGAKGTFASAPNASNRINTRWGPGYQLGAQGSGDYIKTLVSAADCRQGNVAIVLGFSNYTVPPFGYAALAVREPQGTYTYGAADPVWVVEADTSALYWDNGNAGGEQTRATGPGGGVGVNAFLTGRDNLNIVAVTDNGTTAGTNTYINNGLLSQFAGSTTLQYGTAAASTDSVQFGNNWGGIAGDYFRGCLHFAYIFKRALSLLEIASLSANPYQLWVPESIQVQLIGDTTANATLSLTGVAGTGAAGNFSETSSLLLPYCLGVGQAGTLRTNLGVSLGPIPGATGSVGNLTSASPVMAGNAATGTVGLLTPQSAETLAGNAATGLLGTPFLGQGVTPPGAAVTASLGSLTTVLSLALASTALSGVPGALQAQGSLAAYLTGNAGTGAAGTFGLGAGSGVIPTGVAATGTAGTTTAGIVPTLFGTGATGGAGRLSLSGVVANGGAELLGSEAAGMVGDIAVDSEAQARPEGAFGRAGVGTLVPSLPGVWTKTRPKAGTWIKEF